MSILNNFLKRRTVNYAVQAVRLLSKQTPKNSKNLDVHEMDKPIKFSTSPASRYKAITSLRNDSNDRLWYEPHVILASISILLIYFSILREENDLDEQLSTPLQETLKRVERIQLENVLEHSTEETKETVAARLRLKELEESEKNSLQQ